MPPLILFIVAFAISLLVVLAALPPRFFLESLSLIFTGIFYALGLTLLAAPKRAGTHNTRKLRLLQVAASVVLILAIGFWTVTDLWVGLSQDFELGLVMDGLYLSGIVFLFFIAAGVFSFMIRKRRPERTLPKGMG